MLHFTMTVRIVGDEVLGPTIVKRERFGHEQFRPLGAPNRASSLIDDQRHFRRRHNRRHGGHYRRYAGGRRGSRCNYLNIAISGHLTPINDLAFGLVSGHITVERN